MGARVMAISMIGATTPLTKDEAPNCAGYVMTDPYSVTRMRSPYTHSTSSSGFSDG